MTSCDYYYYVTIIIIHIVLNVDYTYGNNVTVTGCQSETSCLKCGPSGCVKCTNKIVYPSRRCADDCPYGYRERWSTKTDFMGRICVAGNNGGVTNETLTLLTGIIVGLVLSAMVIGAAYAYIRYKMRTVREQQRLQQQADNVSEIDDVNTPERKDFYKQIETIRPYAHTFLAMLNDTRRQMRELYREGDNTALAAYRPIVRDLAKVLLLLNRPIERIAIPDDWEHLYNWAEKTLKRYKRMSEASQPQVAQLINFLQGPLMLSDDLQDERSINRSNTTMSTFKPDKPLFDSTLSLHDSQYDGTFLPSTTINPQWKFDFSTDGDTGDGGVGTALTGSNSEFDPAAWKSSKEFLNNTYFLDDDFSQLGFRPQDEITTEL